MPVVVCNKETISSPGIRGVRELYERLSEIRPELVKRMSFVTGDTIGDSMGEFVRSTGRPILEKPFTKAGVRTMLAVLMAPEPVE